MLSPSSCSFRPSHQPAPSEASLSGGIFAHACHGLCGRRLRCLQNRKQSKSVCNLSDIQIRHVVSVMRSWEASSYWSYPRGFHHHCDSCLVCLNFYFMLHHPCFFTSRSRLCISCPRTLGQHLNLEDFNSFVPKTEQDLLSSLW